MPSLATFGQIEGLSAPAVVKVATPADYARDGWPPERSALWIDEDPITAKYPQVLRHGWAACISRHRKERPLGWKGPWVSALTDGATIAPGDVIAITPHSPRIRILYRRGSNSNALFVTHQCNNRCLVCAQPPRAGKDIPLEEALALLPLIDKTEPSLGVTGGEPTLLGEGLVTIVTTAAKHLPNTQLHILTNGRLLGRTDLAQRISLSGHPDVLWGVSLHADTARAHDALAGAVGAFDETLRGIYQLAANRQRVEIRVVLQCANTRRLEQLAYFIYRNLSFVSHIAFMGLEPIGLARANRNSVWADPHEYAEALEAAAYFLANRGLSVSVYNLPHCVLPQSLWRFARKSISDWKNSFREDCHRCAAFEQCAGFFESADDSWVSRIMKPICKHSEEGVEASCETG